MSIQCHHTSRAALEDKPNNSRHPPSVYKIPPREASRRAAVMALESRSKVETAKQASLSTDLCFPAEKPIGP